MSQSIVRTTFAVGIAAIAASSFNFSAEAATLETNGAGIVTGIQELSIDSTVYDVSFERANFQSLFGDETQLDKATPTFWGNQAGAESAVAAINAFLTTQNIFAVNPGIFLGNEDAYLIPFATPGADTISVVQGLATVNSWSSALLNVPAQGGGNSQFVYAVFTPSATAIPTPALIPGLIGMGIAALRKRRAMTQDTES